MIFLRTNSGLSNQHLFVGVDAVVFLEGGKSYSLEEIEQGYCNVNSSDIRFWSRMFSSFKPSSKFDFRSIGSKEILKVISVRIKNREVNNVVVAMDRDHDFFKGSMLESDNVIYTQGYSWENDVCTNSIVLQTYQSMVGAAPSDKQKVGPEIDSLYDEFVRGVKGAVRLDIVLSLHDYSFFNRDSYFRYIKVARNLSPCIDLSQIKDSLSKIKKEMARQMARPLTRINDFIYDVSENCWGHLLFEYWFRVILFLVDRTTNEPKIPRTYFTSTIVDKFMSSLQGGLLLRIQSYYEGEFSKVTV